MQCGNHICSVIYANNMKFSLQVSGLFLVTQLMPVTSFLILNEHKCMAYICNLMNIFVSGTCVAIKYDIDVVIGSILTPLYT